MSGAPVAPPFSEATAAEVREAVSVAVLATPALATSSVATRAGFFSALAGLIVDDADELLERAVVETGSTRERAAGELARLSVLLRNFAEHLNANRFTEAVIETARDGRSDLRRLLVPIGPVAVFEASNLPFFLGAAGCDAVAAWSAACPVIVKGHPAHPGTSEMIGRLVRKAGEASGLPEGLFSLLHAESNAAGELLAGAEEVRAVAFTGSQAGGRAIHAIASRRQHLIPVYAEMGSSNPVFLTEQALVDGGAQIAEALATALAMNNGQLCTKPGLVFVPDGHATGGFGQMLAAAVGTRPFGPLLNRRIEVALRERVNAIAGAENVFPVPVPPGTAKAHRAVDVRLFRTSWRHAVLAPWLLDETFGPVMILVECSGSEMLDAARTLPGQLTATVYARESDPDALALMSAVTDISGRVVWKAMPTGVEVSPAMHHGGPFPASTLPAHTSVGHASVRRFQRPVAFQNVPQLALPPVLRDENPLGIERLVDGAWTKSAIPARREDGRGSDETRAKSA